LGLAVWSVLKGNNLSLEWPRYGLNVPGFERRWEQDFPYPVRPAPRPTHLPVEWVPAFFPWNKAAGEWRWPSTSVYRRG